MLTEEVKNELLVLESVYCRPGEFTRLGIEDIRPENELDCTADSDTVRLKLAEETFLTVSVGMETGYPASPPALSLAAAALPRARAHTLTQGNIVVIVFPIPSSCSFQWDDSFIECFRAGAVCRRT